MDRTMMYRDLSDSEFVKRCERTSPRSTRASRASRATACGCTSATATGKARTSTTFRWRRSCRRSTPANVGALTIEFSNPRHAHEYTALKKHPLPPHMLLIPGVVETTSNFVEHPEVVARRIEEAVAAVGDRERVIASTDCGFGTFTKREWVIEPVVWLKLKAIREGADIASQRLWGKKVA
jgi:5-methyltetrahydropteroyltriglutamate--homocysteine methyltransferase